MIFSPLVAWAVELTPQGQAVKEKVAGMTKGAGVSSFSSLIDKVIGVLDKIVPLLIGVAVVVFLYGVLKFITAAGDETKRKEGKDVIIYGIIGLFVMVSVWGLVKLLISTFSLSTGIPTIPGL